MQCINYKRYSVNTLLKITIFPLLAIFNFFETITKTVNLKSFTVLYTGQDSVIYQGKHPEHNDVAVKMLRTDYPSAAQLQRIINEHGIGTNLDILGVRKIFELTKIDNRPALILELIDGKPIKQNLSLFTSNIGFFLDTAIRIASALNNLHERNIIHKDLNSNNIFY